jgi:hypothetical protein
MLAYAGVIVCLLNINESPFLDKLRETHLDS